jgi:DNA/RNA-binding domain of Phe-tRNA-synthetase-like protein
MTRFHLSPAVAEKGVVGAYSLLVDFQQPAASVRQAEEFVNGVVDQVRRNLVGEAVSTDPILAGYDELHKAFQIPTRKLHAAPETLFRYVEKRGDIPRINPFVDVYNAVSLETRLALGAHDLDRINGDVSLRLTTGAEGFHPVGAEVPEPIRPGEYAYVDDADDVICRLEVRQVEKTKVTDSTTGVFLIVQGNRRTPPALVQAGHDRLVDVLRQFFGGRAVPLYRP